MSERKIVKVRTQIESILSKWKDSHEDKKLEQRLFQSLDVNSNLEVLLRIKPRHYHCAETLLNLYDLKKHLENVFPAYRFLVVRAFQIASQVRAERRGRKLSPNSHARRAFFFRVKTTMPKYHAVPFFSNTFLIRNLFTLTVFLPATLVAHAEN